MKQRDEQDLSADVRRELEALDRALAGQPVDADLDGVATLARELRDARPEPNDDFTAELDDRAARGFPADGPSRSSFADRVREWLAGVQPLRVLAPAGAVATVVLVASVAVIQSGGGEDATTPVVSSQESTVPEADRQAATAGDAAVEAPLPESGAAGGTAQGLDAFDETTVPEQSAGADRNRIAPSSGREVESSASLSLSTDEDEFEEVADGVVGITDRYRGFVLSSEESAFGDRSRASFELEIPSQKLQVALADLSELAHVESRTEDSLDITAPTVTARQQLTDARAEVESLLGQLAEADTPKETEAIRFRLDIARADAARAKAEFQKLARRANYANVSVTVVSGGGGDGDWGAGDAVEDIGDALSTVGGVALIAAVILLPFALVIAVFTFAWRRSVRRGRERVLDDQGLSR